MDEGLSSCCSRSSFDQVEGADWVPNPPSLSSSLAASPRQEANEEEDRSEVSSPKVHRSFHTPEGCDWTLPPEVLANLSPTVGNAHRVAGREGGGSEILMKQLREDAPLPIEKEPPTQTAKVIPCPCCGQLQQAYSLPERELESGSTLCSTQEPTESIPAVEAEVSYSELHRLNSERNKLNSPAELPVEYKESVLTMESDKVISKLPGASQVDRQVSGAEPCQEPEPKLVIQGFSSAVQCQVTEPKLMSRRSFIPSAGVSHPASDVAVVKVLEEKTKTVPGAVMSAATPVRGVTPTTSAAAKFNHGTRTATRSESGRQSQAKAPSALNISSCRKNAVPSQSRAITNVPHGRPNFAFQPPSRSLALGPPRNCERSRLGDRVASQPASSTCRQPLKMASSAFPFSERHRSRNLSPPMVCRTAMPGKSASIRMIQQRSESSSARWSPERSPPPVPTFCGSAAVTPGGSVQRSAISSSARGDSQSMRRQLYPLSVGSTLGRLSSGMPVLDSSASGRQSSTSESWLPPDDSSSRMVVPCSPKRAQSLGASPLNFSLTQSPLEAPSRASFVAPPVSVFKFGSYVAPPQLGSYVAPPHFGSYVAPPQLGSFVAPPQIGSHVPPPITGSYCTPRPSTPCRTSSVDVGLALPRSPGCRTLSIVPPPMTQTVRCTSPDRPSFVAPPPVPMSPRFTSPNRTVVAACPVDNLQVGPTEQVRSFMQSLPQSLRCTSPSSSVAVPASARRCASPMGSYVSPPLPSQCAVQRATSVDHLGQIEKLKRPVMPIF